MHTCQFCSGDFLNRRVSNTAYSSHQQLSAVNTDQTSDLLSFQVSKLILWWTKHFHLPSFSLLENVVMSTAEHAEHVCCQHSSPGTDRQNLTTLPCWPCLCGHPELSRKESFLRLWQKTALWSSHGAEKLPVKALEIDFSLLLGGVWEHNKFNRLKNKNKMLQTFFMTCQWRGAELVLPCKISSDFAERRKVFCCREPSVLQHTSKSPSTRCKCSPGHLLHLMGV